MPDSMPPVLPNGVLRYRVDRVVQDVEDQDKRLEKIEAKIDRLILAVVLSALTVAGSVLVFAITLMATKGTP